MFDWEKIERIMPRSYIKHGSWCWKWKKYESKFKRLETDVEK